MTRSGYRITTDDASTLTDEQVLLGASLFNVFEQEIWPEDPVTPAETFLAEHRAHAGAVDRTHIRAWALDGQLAGSVELRVDRDDTDNPDVLRCGIYVHPEHRRQGVGTRLLEEVSTVARSAGRSRLVGTTFSRSPAGELFAAHIGAQAKSWARKNHLPVQEVDRSLMELWVSEGPERAANYELLSWDGPVPDEHLEAFVGLMAVMNDAPTDDLELNDATLTPAQWREGERQAAAVGQERWLLIARRKTDGALAGLHELDWVPAFPNVMWVGSTGVRSEDRGHALGKWMKAAMMLRVLSERPEIADIRTENAVSNDAMLGINDQMGYRELLAVTTWELGVAPPTADSPA